MMRIESVEDVDDMARGAVLLGTGGGGDPYIGSLFVNAQIKKGRYPIILSPDEVPDDAFVLTIAGIGAPLPLVEHLLSERHLLQLLARAEAFFGRKIDVLVCAEIGGGNSMMPLAVSAITGIPVVDADGIGRAFPRVEMTSFSIQGIKATPGVLMDVLGNVVTLEATSDRMAEQLCRAVTTPMGAFAVGALYPMTGKDVKRTAVLRTVTQTLEVGRCIRTARENSSDVFDALIACLRQRDDRFAKIVFDGKITDVAREVRDGWHWGKITIQSFDETPDTCVVEMQNEFIVARINGEIAVVVPDLICILDRDSGEPITGEALAYGQRVKVLGYQADPLMARPEALEVVGPRTFGINETFRSIKELSGAKTPPR